MNVRDILLVINWISDGLNIFNYHSIIAILLNANISDIDMDNNAILSVNICLNKM